MPEHTSVLLEEALAYLDPKPGDRIVDGTLGFGGHAGRILEKLGPKGHLIGFDRDPEAIVKAKKRLSEFGDRALMIQSRFSHMREELKAMGQGPVQGVLLDLGVSSFQLDEPRRGFSFRQEGPLDMRMDPTQPMTAARLVNETPKEKLMQVLWTYGEERFARRIVEAIVQARERRRLETTSDLASIIERAVPGKYRHGRIHPATRTFQALRIVVNSEMEELENFLSDALEILESGGRVVIISFHSLEDRQVKNAFRRFKTEGQGEILTKKPVTASEEEAAANPRARSAKLRAFRKTAGREAQ